MHELNYKIVLYMSWTLPKKTDFSEPLISKAD